MKKIIFLIFIVSLNISLYSEEKKESPYETLALEISSTTLNMGESKLAVLPFSYAESTASIKDGSIIAERLTMKLIQTKKIEIIERSVLDKVLNELKLENSGAIDVLNAKELGKVLGVNLILTGTLVKTKDNKIEVNARLIKVETAEAVKSFQIYVIKDWLGGEKNKKTPVDIKRFLRQRRIVN